MIEWIPAITSILTCAIMLLTGIVSSASSAKLTSHRLERIEEELKELRKNRYCEEHNRMCYRVDLIENGRKDGK